MEELLQQKNYYCKPNSGLKMNCKLISGLINKNCKLFLGRYTIFIAPAVVKTPLKVCANGFCGGVVTEDGNRVNYI